MLVEVTTVLGDRIELKTAQPGGTIGGFLENLEGWYGVPAPKESTESVGMVYGDAWPNSLSPGARIVTIEGYRRFRSSIEAAQFKDKINDLAYIQLEIAVTDELGKRICDGFLSDDPTPKTYENGCVVRFALVVTCPYPFKRGEYLSFPVTGGSATVRNSGNSYSFPKLVVSGRVTSVTMTYRWHTVSWRGNQDGLVLDLNEDISTYEGIIEDDVFSVPPGVSDISVSVSGGTAIVQLAPSWR